MDVDLPINGKIADNNSKYFFNTQLKIDN